MYKVLLVDDERIIVDGISRMVDWAAIGTELAGTAANGLEAFDFIRERGPDIVISDIRMPGMDGLELVERAQGVCPRVRFVLLSGFGEFDYARSAMRFGVKHYLLKPTNEGKIAEALASVVDELRQGEKRDAFVAGMEERLDKMLPHAKEQVLKEFVTNKTYGVRDWEYYRGLFAFGFDRPVRLLLLHPEGPGVEFEHLFAVKNIAEDMLAGALLGTTIGDHALLMIEEPDDPLALQRTIGEVRRVFKAYYKHDVTIALSEPGDMAKARSLYRQTLEIVSHRFYLDEGGLITHEDARGSAPQPVDEFAFAEETLTVPVRSGHREEAGQALLAFVDALKAAQLPIGRAKAHAIGLFVSLIRYAPAERIDALYGRLPAMSACGTLQELRDELERTVRELADYYYEQHSVKHTGIVRKVIGIIEDRIGDAELSLGSVASEMLYMNADYLGKLFKKETGEKFSNYVMKARIKQATELIAANADVKIFELAERLGFGDNPQYFSQVFKKYMGCTPSEYVRAAGADSSAF